MTVLGRSAILNLNVPQLSDLFEGTLSHDLDFASVVIKIISELGL